MRSTFASALFLPLIVLGTLTAQTVAVPSPDCRAPRFSERASIEYVVSLADPTHHRAHVTVLMRDQQGRRIFNLPVWNALYQVRNFAANVENVQAQDADGAPGGVVHTGTSEWQISAREGCVSVSYDIHLDSGGPFGSQLNAEHAFLNWAMVLMYLADFRDRPLAVRFADVPSGWEIRDLHLCKKAAEGSPPNADAAPVIGTVCKAQNYDQLADSPVEAGVFHEASFQQDGATYYVVVDAEPSVYDMTKVEEVVRKISHAGVDWMQDRPYDEYTFLYHFPKGPAGGGMEHAYGTAIDVSADRLHDNYSAVAGVSAHEFFHLWNVKRIRPQSLEPIDYQHEQDTRALWFSEGVTSTVGDLLLLRAGLMDEQGYFDEIGRNITELQRRPAHTWQSVEDSSLDAWFEGNAFYRSPERSISYYNKGDILGVLLDLRIRELTHGQKSLRDLFQWMNEHYAKQHKFFPDTIGVEQAAEAVVQGNGTAEGSDAPQFAEFFREYVRGAQEIPYNDSFRFVGLQVISKTVPVASAGFTVTANIGGQPEIVTVDPGSSAAQAGLAKGDRVVAMDGKPADSSLDDQIAQKQPGDVVTITVANRKGERQVKLHLGSRAEQWYELQDLPSVTPEQRAHRAAWVHGDDESAP